MTSKTSALPILRVKPDDIAPRVLVVGDPRRAAAAAALLQDARQVGENREYVTYTGSFEGTMVSLCSHGVGSAGAAVAFEELARAGVDTIIRAGTCGAIQGGMQDGEVVVATGAVRDEGLTPRLIPLGYPAVADYQVIEALMRVAEQTGAAVHSGVVLTSDLFYPSEALGPVDWRLWQAARVVAVEMELAALLIVAALHGMRAGGILTIDGNPTRSAQDMSEYDPHRTVVQVGVSTMLQIALGALKTLSQQT
ncbi:MAG: nucleoside phosphorylase [Chloroflexota bacterium]|nr:nucleoside phosphorylase [Chloroflexota bacterium]